MIDKYFENIITKNKNKIFKNNKINYIIDKSIDNFNAYIYFIEKYQKITDINNNAIFEFAASFSFEAFINDLVIYNTQSIMILQRVLLELYFKFMFIITSDKFVEDLFLDFK